jgi:hypothetical protein
MRQGHKTLGHVCFFSIFVLCSQDIKLFLCFQFVDDDNKCYLEINYTFDICKDGNWLDWEVSFQCFCFCYMLIVL